jgi:hypothetical protein
MVRFFVVASCSAGMLFRFCLLFLRHEGAGAMPEPLPIPGKN